MIFISIICLLIAALFQFHYFNVVQKQLKKCENLFGKNYSINEGIIKVEDDYSIDLKGILNNTNSYLKKNIGTADFSLLQNITERKEEHLLEPAVSRISFPMYFGLMGTFLGVGLGLFSLVVGNDKSGLAINSSTLSPFLMGVIVAMISSFLGMLLTFLNNRMVAKVDIKMQKGREVYYSFLQLELLPHMGTSIVQSLSQLKNTIGGFETSFSRIIDRFENSFTQVTSSLDNIFTKNLSTIDNAVTKLSSSMADVSQSIEHQQELLRMMQSRTFLQIVENISSSVGKLQTLNLTLTEFQELHVRNNILIQKTLEGQESYNKSLSIPVEAINRINSVLDRISLFEDNINSLGIQLASSQMLGSNLAELIKSHLNNLQRTWDHAEEYSSLSLEQLQKNYQNSISSIERLQSLFENQITTAFDFSYEGNSFKYLGHLPNIDKALDTQIPALLSNLNSELNKIETVIEKINVVTVNQVEITKAINKISINRANPVNGVRFAPNPLKDNHIDEKPKTEINSLTALQFIKQKYFSKKQKQTNR